MLKVKEIQEKEKWEKFFEGPEEKTFLQSWNWGEFQKLEGSKIWRIGVYDENGLIAVSLVIKTEARRGSFLFLPHGPVQSSGNKHQVLRALLEKLKEIAKQEKVDFIRISPIWLARHSFSEGGEKNEEIFKKLGFRKAPIHMHPELSWGLDINLSEQDLLMGMRKTTRYLIKQALKNEDIEIIQSQNPEDIEIFDRINQETVKRHQFAPFSLGYLKNELSVFRPDNQISVFLGKYKGENVVSGIFVFWQGIGFYHHGASSLKYPKIPVAYLLQWEAIKEAKKRNCHTLNFWGIAPEEEKSHPWAGLTLFKKGFGGYSKEYVPAQDFPLSKKYYLTFIFEKLRKMKRGL